MNHQVHLKKFALIQKLLGKFNSDIHVIFIITYG